MPEVSRPSNIPTVTFERLRFFPGGPGEFWPAFVQSLASHAGAAAGVVMLRDESGAWRVIASIGVGPQLGVDAVQLAAAADAAQKDGFTFERTKEGETAMIGLRLESGDAKQACSAVLITKGRTPNLQAVCAQLQLVADTPLLYHNHRRLQLADSQLGQYSDALDLLLLLNAQTRFLGVSLTFCNELAARFRGFRVTLGWKQGRYVRLQAVSHMERFERKMEVVQKLESVMEEAFDQDQEILWPTPEESLAIVRDHAAFSAEQGSAFIVSLPLRVDGEPVGVVVIERQESAFTDAELRTLRLICDQSARRISDLKQSDCWFGLRWARKARSWAGKLIGTEHTGAKLLAFTGMLVLVGVIFIKVPYRVEAPFLVRTGALAQLPAPFDSYIESLDARVGDVVTAGQPLLQLDARDLRVSEAEAEADLRRFQAEADQAVSEQRLGEMRVAQERTAQARAALEMTRLRLSQVKVSAPFDGVIVHGDLRERIGSPVKRGEVLFKVSRINELYAELKVSERDIHEVLAGAHGELAFTSRPDLGFPIRVERVEPSALAESEGNIFLVRADFAESGTAWWRPGMSGLAKVDVGRRSILWVVTHRAIDFLRMRLWW